MRRSFQVGCGSCSTPICWHHGGDPYLPYLLCDACHEAEELNEMDAEQARIDAALAERGVR